MYMNVLILICARLVKLFANITKILSYVFHWIFPRKRFTLPKESGPLLSRQKQHDGIPRVIWQTNFTDKCTLPVYLNYLFNRVISPTYSYRFHITEDRRAYIAQHYGAEVLGLYERLQIGAAQADLWRVLVLYREGGVYLDIDAHVVRPLEWILKPEDTEAYVLTRRGDVSNYFFASRAGNPNLKAIQDQILENIRRPLGNNVFDITGPGVFNRVLDLKQVKLCYYRYTCAQGTFTNEYFQYIDKKEGKWTKQQNTVSVVAQDDREAL